jgi:DNA-binding MarR family transcriptional regulator
MSEPPPSNDQDSVLALLERVQAASIAESRLTQRELARSVGLSLGMTNILVRRLVERGWLALRRHSAKSITYLLTPEGTGEIARRTRGYFERASRLVAAQGERIEAFVMEARRKGATAIVLVGSSPSDFILERSCETHGLVFMKSANPDKARALAQRPDVVLAWGDDLSATIALPGTPNPVKDLRE